MMEKKLQEKKEVEKKLQEKKEVEKNNYFYWIFQLAIFLWLHHNEDENILDT